MKSKKVYAYVRVASSEHRSAWILERRNHQDDDISFELHMAAFRKKCVNNKYFIIGETIIKGDGKKAIQRIKDILAKNSNIDFILSPTVQSLSQSISEALKTVEYMRKCGVTFLSADDGELKNPRNDLLVIKDLCDDMLTDSTEKPMLPPMSL